MPREAFRLRREVIDQSKAERRRYDRWHDLPSWPDSTRTFSESSSTGLFRFADFWRMSGHGFSHVEMKSGRGNRNPRGIEVPAKSIVSRRKAELWSTGEGDVSKGGRYC